VALACNCNAGAGRWKAARHVIFGARLHARTGLKPSRQRVADVGHKETGWRLDDDVRVDEGEIGMAWQGHRFLEDPVRRISNRDCAARGVARGDGGNDDDASIDCDGGGLDCIGGLATAFTDWDLASAIAREPPDPVDFPCRTFSAEGRETRLDSLLVKIVPEIAAQARLDGAIHDNNGALFDRRDVRCKLPDLAAALNVCVWSAESSCNHIVLAPNMSCRGKWLCTSRPSAQLIAWMHGEWVRPTAWRWLSRFAEPGAFDANSATI